MGQAFAYPFMIRHGYTGCAQCHLDPSGGGPLTAYGRGQAEIFMRSRYGVDLPEEGPGKIKDFAYGVVPLPDPLLMQADVRGMLIPEPGNMRFLLMQSDLRAGLSTDKVVASGSIGYVSEGGINAWLSSNEGSGGNLVSREYWAGYKPNGSLLIRGGRMNLPYSIRSEEHILYARNYTRTTTNDDQQLGLDVVYGKKKLRAEAMGIAGNFQISPDDFRERGYSALVAWAITNRFEVGLSSLLTHAALDVDTREERLRQSHGLFGRYSPTESLALFAEADLLLDSNAGVQSTGSIGFLQADFEPVQGLHLKATGEWCDNDFSDTDAANLRGSGTILWFLAPHTDIRLDAMYGTLYCAPGVDPTPMGMVQLHTFL